jgi:hypothetical protein
MGDEYYLEASPAFYTLFTRHNNPRLDETPVRES